MSPNRLTCCAIALLALLPAGLWADSWRGTLNGWGEWQMTNTPFAATRQITFKPVTNDIQEFKYYDGAAWYGYGGANALPNFSPGILSGDGGAPNNVCDALTNLYFTFHCRADHALHAISVTTNPPVDIANQGQALLGHWNGARPVTVQLTAPKSDTERIYARWSADGWTSWDVGDAASGEATNYVAIMGDQADGASVSFYILTTTFPTDQFTTAAMDLVTLKGDVNGGANYAYRVLKPQSRWPTNAAVAAALGDTNVQVYMDTYQNTGNEAGAPQARSWVVAYAKQGDADLASGASAGPGRAPGGGTDETWAYAPQFTGTGTWYYALRVSYGADTNFWVVSSNSAYGAGSVMAMYPTACTLRITVTNLPAPGSPSAVLSPTNPTAQIDLSWVRRGSYRTLVARRAGSDPDVPAQGHNYTNGETYGDGAVVVCEPAAGEAWSDTGLSPGTVYHYGFFTENNGYYSSGVYDYEGTESGGDASLALVGTSIVFSLYRGAGDAGAFAVVNDGTAVLRYTNTVAYLTGSGWVSVSPTQDVVGVGARITNIVAVNASGLATGVYEANIAVDGNQTNETGEVAVTLNVIPIPVPSNVTLTADGPEAIDMTWEAPAGMEVLVVHRAGGAPASSPVDGVGYDVEDDLAVSGEVKYRGAAPAAKAVELYFDGSGGYTAPLEPEVYDWTHYFDFYTITAETNYSAKAQYTVGTEGYEEGTIVDPMSANVGGGLGGSAGAGFHGKSVMYSLEIWTYLYNGQATRATFKMTNDVPVNFQDMPLYPAGHALAAALVYTNILHSNAYASYRRSFPREEVATGRVFAACMVSYEHAGSNLWVGMGFMDGTSRKAFFGKAPRSERTLGIVSEEYGGATNALSSHDMDPFDESTNNTYLLVGKFDFDTREVSARAYYRTDAVPYDEPSDWQVTAALPPWHIATVDGIFIMAGCTNDSTSVGRVYFDEVRVATNWTMLVTASNSLPTAQILQPADWTEGLQHEVLHFAGCGTDEEDGELTNLAWHSDADGDFAWGTNTTCSVLSTGLHAITLRAVDTGGGTGTAAAALMVLADDDTNGLPDAWEGSYVWPGGASGGGTNDPDGDGLPNFGEWLAESDPTNAQSVFRIDEAGRAGAAYVIEWSARSNRFYGVHWATNLNAGFEVLTGGLRRAQNGMLAHTDSVHNVEEVIHYRISVGR